MNHSPFCTLSADKISKQIILIPFCQKYDSQVNHLLDAAFGIDRHKKSSYKLRETCLKIDDLSLVAIDKKSGDILASIAYWQLKIAGEKALLLGPLAVNPTYQGQGLGKYLMDETLKLANKIAPLRGWKFTILIGDLDYYQKSGFQRVPFEVIDYPQPTDTNRVLYFEFEPNSLQLLIDEKPLPLRLNEND